MRVSRATVRAALAGALLLVALGAAGAPPTAHAARAAQAPEHPAPAVVARGVPLERLPEEPPRPAAARREPGAPPGVLLLGAGAGVLVLLVLRQRRSADPGADVLPGVPGLATGTPALVRALTAALADGDEPVGLVLLRVEPRPPAAGRPSAEGWRAADDVLEALDVAVPLVAEQVGLRARGGDRVVRLGVNRLAVVLPGAAASEAGSVGERLRAGVAAAAAPGLAVDVGAAGFPADGTLPSALLRAAERSLRLGVGTAA